MQPWQMTEAEYIDANRQRLLADGVNADEIDYMIPMWRSEYNRAMNQIPRDADVPLRVLESLPADLLARVCKWSEPARQTWLDRDAPWRMSYRSYLNSLDDYRRHFAGNVREFHRQSVLDAMRDGKPVPPQVAAEYTA